MFPSEIVCTPFSKESIHFLTHIKKYTTILVGVGALDNPCTNSTQNILQRKRSPVGEGGLPKARRMRCFTPNTTLQPTPRKRKRGRSVFVEMNTQASLKITYIWEQIIKWYVRTCFFFFRLFSFSSERKRNWQKRNISFKFPLNTTVAQMFAKSIISRAGRPAHIWQYADFNHKIYVIMSENIQYLVFVAYATFFVESLVYNNNY